MHGQRGLAEAAGPDHRGHGDGPRAVRPRRPRQPVAEILNLLGPAGEVGNIGGQLRQRGQRLHGGGEEGSRREILRVGREDLLVETLQFGAGVDA